VEVSLDLLQFWLTSSRVLPRFSGWGQAFSYSWREAYIGCLGLKKVMIFSEEHTHFSIKLAPNFDKYLATYEDDLSYTLFKV
jgi:hypothetical protein